MNEILTLQEVAHILHIHPETIRLWIKDGIFQAVKTPGARPLYRIKRETLNALLNTSQKAEETQL